MTVNVKVAEVVVKFTAVLITRVFITVLTRVSRVLSHFNQTPSHSFQGPLHTTRTAIPHGLMGFPTKISQTFNYEYKHYTLLNTTELSWFVKEIKYKQNCPSDIKYAPFHKSVRKNEHTASRFAHLTTDISLPRQPILYVLNEY
jgi:hypothetical protein